MRTELPTEILPTSDIPETGRGNTDTLYDVTTATGVTIASVTPLEEEYWQTRVYSVIFQYVSPAILAVGLFGNIFALVVLQRGSMRTSGACFLLSALAVSDMGCLLTELLNNWVKEVTGSKVNIRGYNIHTCRLHVFLTFLCHHLSPMTLMFLTVQRVICVYLPLKAKVICSRSKVIKMWLVIAILFAGFNSMAFFTVTFDTRVSGINMNCFYNNDVIDWFNTTDSVLESYLPCSVIVLGNILIVVRVRKAQMKRLKQMATRSASKKVDGTEAMTTMLVVVTTTFVLLTTPFYIWINGTHEWGTYADDPLLRAKSHFAYAVTYHLLELNFAVNFILYCIFGRRFRSTVKRMMGCGCRDREKGETSFLGSIRGQTPLSNLGHKQ